ncbi:hypothetical protein ACFV0L_43550 [Streptosporangium canum]|uniref:hypothetical protein n=1 Tax=Streptosporangium canum TaxID=324952 RepID=UPI0036968167
MALPWQRQPSTVQRKRLVDLVDAAWTAGWTSEALRAELVAELSGARSLYAVWASRLQDLPAPRVGETAGAALPPKCDDPECGPDRLIPVGDDAVQRCPRCHPGAVATPEGGPR